MYEEKRMGESMKAVKVNKKLWTTVSVEDIGEIAPASEIAKIIGCGCGCGCGGCCCPYLCYVLMC